MFINSRKLAISANRLATRNLSYRNDNVKSLIDCSTPTTKKLHTTTARPALAATAILPIPNNIDAAETTRFSPNRSRDISATVILSQYNNQSAAMPSIDITADNSLTNISDPHVQSYDCFGAVSLNSSMQSNVPTPFGGMHKFSHLNMPGGQWSQEGKFTSQNLHSSHYTNLREQSRADWVAYDQNATINKANNGKAVGATTSAAATATTADTSSTAASIILTNWNSLHKRHYCTKVKLDEKPPAPELSKKEQLKKAFKDYGATVIVFHVAISLASLGACYLLVSGGVDMMAVLNYLGLGSTALSTKIATGASTFVVAYAIHKVFAPVRISITLGATPFIVRYLRSKGIIKPNQNIKK